MVLYVIPRRVSWFDTVPGRVDALATMSLMQMIADAYENTHDMWEHDDDSTLDSTPNEAQEAVRAWLAYAHFLPPLPQKQLPAVHQLAMQTEVSSRSTVSNPPQIPSRKWRISMDSMKMPRKRTHSGSTNSRSILSLSPSKLWRRRRESTSSFIAVSGSSILSTPPSTPSKSSRSPVRSYTTPTYTKRPRFPTKTPYREESTFDNIQVSPSPQIPTRMHSPNTLQSTFYSPNDITTRRTLSFPTRTPWLTRSLSTPSLTLTSSSSSSFESPLWSPQKPVLDKDPSEDRPPDVTLWTLFVITMLGYLFFFFLFLGCFLIAIYKLFGIFWSATDE